MPDYKLFDESGVLKQRHQKQALQQIPKGTIEQLVYPLVASSIFVLTCNTPISSPLVDFLQCISGKGCSILEDVVERMEGAEFPSLFFMVDGRRWCRGYGQCRVCPFLSL